MNLLISNRATFFTSRGHVRSVYAYTTLMVYAYVQIQQACLAIWNSLTSIYICIIICAIYVYTYKRIQNMHTNQYR